MTRKSTCYRNLLMHLGRAREELEQVEEEAWGLAYELEDKQHEIDRLRARVAELEAVVEPARELCREVCDWDQPFIVVERQKALRAALDAAEKGGAA